MKFDKSTCERYRGHLSLCEIDLQGQKSITEARVLIVGAGGLGSPVALYLAAAGVGTIGIVDADVVSMSNLQRQIMHTTSSIGEPKTLSAKRSMTNLNPLVNVVIHDFMLTGENAPSLVSQYDVVVDCTDSRCSRLIVNDACVAVGRPFVYGSVSRFSGLLFTCLPGTADYRARFSDEADGNEELKSCAMTGILNTVVGVVGSLQATEVIKIITGVGDLLTDKLLTFDAINMEFHTFTVA